MAVDPGQGKPAPGAVLDTKATDQKLDPALRAVADAAMDGSESIATAAMRFSVPMESGRIRVQITSSDATKNPAIAARVKELGGDVAAQLGTAIFADIPPARIREIAAGSEVWNMSVPARAAVPQRP